MQPIFWLAALILFGVGEAVTVGLTSIWFALGSLGALIVSSLGFGFWPQFITFVVLSAISMALSSPTTPPPTRTGCWGPPDWLPRRSTTSPARAWSISPGRFGAPAAARPTA